MPKRSNPFVEDFIPQSKTYVNMKQFNNNVDRMQKVYEKTLQLLFKGAKKAPEETIPALDAVPLAKKDCMKQLLINKDGTLVNSKTIQENGQPRVVCERGACGCGGAAEAACAYCEARLCGACGRPCARCTRVHCDNCSLLGSEGTKICVSCYG